MIWPYAVAPPVVGVLWVFMLNPSLGVLAQGLRNLGFDWNPLLDGNQAAALVILASVWKQISYNFLFFLAGLQAIPSSVIEAAAIDGARPVRRFCTIIFPLLSPTIFFLIVINVGYAFFDTFGIIDTMTRGGPAKATETLVYKVYLDGLLGSNLGCSAAQPAMRMAIVNALTATKFLFAGRTAPYCCCASRTPASRSPSRPEGGEKPRSKRRTLGECNVEQRMPQSSCVPDAM